MYYLDGGKPIRRKMHAAALYMSYNFLVSVRKNSGKRTKNVIYAKKPYVSANKIEA